jgi:hypothetical protein
VLNGPLVTARLADQVDGDGVRAVNNCRDGFRQPDALLTRRASAVQWLFHFLEGESTVPRAS